MEGLSLLTKLVVAIVVHTAALHYTVLELFSGFFLTQPINLRRATLVIHTLALTAEATAATDDGKEISA